MTRDEIVEAGRQHLFPAVRHLYSDPLVIDRAKDQYVWDAEGRQYLDFFGGIVVISVGHLNDKVREAVHRQVDRLHHASTLFPTEPQAALAKRIAEVTPGRKLTKSFFTNSGTEANETAVALARVYTGNFEIIALRHSYHGRSDAARSLSGQSPWRGPLPLQAGYVHAHNAYCYRCPFGKSYPSCGVACARDVE